MITLNTHPTSEVNQKATHILFKQMGVVDTFKFLNQFTLGYGDYTKERAELLGDVTLKQIVKEIKINRSSL